MSNTNNVIGLRGEAYSGGAEIVAEVVEDLEYWLEAAKSGEVTGIAVAVSYRDTSTGSRRSGLVSRALAGQCYSLGARINSAIDDALLGVPPSGAA